MRLASSNVTVAADTFSFDVTIENLIEQAMGTTDGVTPHPDGVRAFFHALPTTTSGSGSIIVANPSGSASFTGTNQPYFQYDGMLYPDSVTEPQRWKLHFDPGVETFVFTLYVASEVQYMQDRVVLDETPEFLLEGEGHAIGAVVRTRVGTEVAGASIAWASSDSTVAMIDGSGLVTALSPGRVTVTATHGGVTSEATFDVCPDLEVGEVYTATYPAAATLCLGGEEAATEFTYIPVNYSTSSALELTVTATGIQAATGPPTPFRAPDPLRGTNALSTDAFIASHLGVLAQGRSLSRSMGSASLLSLRPEGGVQRAITPGVPSVGDIWGLNVAEGCTGATDIRYGRVRTVGTTVIILADTTNPAGDFTLAQYDSIALELDSIATPTLISNFGEPTDLDDNGRVVAFFTGAVNELAAPASSVVNYATFQLRDIYANTPTGCTRSNEGEIIYMLAPDPTGAINGNVRTAELVRDNTTRSFGHELQHLINASRRIHLLETDAEEPWLDEGLSQIAEELMFYRMVPGLTPGLNIRASDLTSSSLRVEAYSIYQNPNFTNLLPWLQRPDTTGAFGGSDPGSPAMRGATWAFLRYAADRAAPGSDQQAFWSSLVSGATGRANLEAVLGADPALWLRDFAVAMYADDAVNAASEYSNPSWNFRSMYVALLNASYPLAPRPLTSNIPLTLSYAIGGGTVYHRLGVPANAFARVDAASGGSPPAGTFHLAVLRTK